MTTYWICDAAGEIINAVETTSLARAIEVCDMMEGRLRVIEHPTRDQLARYRYWNERP